MKFTSLRPVVQYQVRRLVKWGDLFYGKREFGENSKFFSDLNDEVKPIELTNDTIGYYQSTTCKISLSEFFITNSISMKDIFSFE